MMMVMMMMKILLAEMCRVGDCKEVGHFEAKF